MFLSVFALGKFPGFTPGFDFLGPEIFHISNEIFIILPNLGNLKTHISGIFLSKIRKSPKRPQKTTPENEKVPGISKARKSAGYILRKQYNIVNWLAYREVRTYVP